MPTLEDMFSSIPGLKADRKVDWTETSKEDWKYDWDVVPGAAIGAIPLNTTPPAISGTVTVGSTLTCSAGVWTGNPTPVITYQWRRAGVDIVGATNPSYTLVVADRTNIVQCRVLATNVVGSNFVMPATVAVP